MKRCRSIQWTRRAICLVIALISSCLGTVTNIAIAGVVYYVSPSGSNRNVGTSTDRPFRTIQKAARTARPGDTVRVMAGTYIESVRLTRSGEDGAPITFTAHGDGPAILDGQYRGCPAGGVPSSTAHRAAFIGAGVSHIMIEGLEVTRYCYSGIYFEGDSSDLTILNNSVHHNGNTLPDGDPDDDLLSGGIRLIGYEPTAPVRDALIENNTVVENVSTNSTSGSGIDAFFVMDCTIRGNLVDRNNGNGILIEDSQNVLAERNIIRNNMGDFDGWGTAGIWLDGGSIVTVRGNWIERNVWAGLEITDEESSDPYGYEIVNNVLVGNRYGMYISGIGQKGKPRNRIYNNTIVDSTGIGVWLHHQWVPAETQLKFTDFFNNIVSQQGQDRFALIVEGNPYEGVVLNKNLYYREGGAAPVKWKGRECSVSQYRKLSGWDSAGRSGAPFFRDADLLDYHLLASSPAQDAGSSRFMPSDDYDGHSRPVGQRVDIGAFEGTGPRLECP